MVDAVFPAYEEATSSSHGNRDSSGLPDNSKGSGIRVRNAVLKALCLLGGALLVRKFTRSATRSDHARIVAEALCGEKFSSEQAARDPMAYFNLRMLTCPVTTMVDGSRVLYFEQAFWRTPEKPYRQRFYDVKPCPKEMMCDVEVASYAVRDIQEYRNFCDRLKIHQPQSQEVIGDIAEHLTTVYLSQCEAGRQCLYQGSTPPGGFPNSWNGASHCTSELTIYRNGEIHCWDRGYDEEGNQGVCCFRPLEDASFDFYANNRFGVSGKALTSSKMHYHGDQIVLFFHWICLPHFLYRNWRLSLLSCCRTGAS